VGDGVGFNLSFPNVSPTHLLPEMYVFKAPYRLSNEFEGASLCQGIGRNIGDVENKEMGRSGK